MDQDRITKNVNLIKCKTISTNINFRKALFLGDNTILNWVSTFFNENHINIILL